MPHEAGRPDRRRWAPGLLVVAFLYGAALAVLAVLILKLVPYREALVGASAGLIVGAVGTIVSIVLAHQRACEQDRRESARRWADLLDGLSAAIDDYRAARQHLNALEQQYVEQRTEAGADLFNDGHRICVQRLDVLRQSTGAVERVGSPDLKSLVDELSEWSERGQLPMLASPDAKDWMEQLRRLRDA